MAKRLTAKFPGTCVKCPTRIETGDRIVWEPGRSRHLECPPAPAHKATPAADYLGDPAALMAVFTTASKHLKFPKIRIPFASSPVGSIRLYLSGPNSKAPGTINVVDDAGFGHGNWYGRIELDGKFTAGHRAPADLQAEVLMLVVEMLHDPVVTAAKYGRLAGNCCFCHLPLTDERSTTAGYGPVCAQHWGLPWGHKETV